ncbi:MAG: hypothetical protein DCC68_24910 [Planctomycetota bacterium]|nr:MAG: hypothetical protein DCC68_24910 [Planctomycetota bacterium]
MMPLVAWLDTSAAAMPLMLAARRGFRGGDMSWVVVGALAVAAIAALWLATRWWLGEGSARMRNSPRALFAELCRAHALCAADRQLLLALAEFRQLANLGELFVNPTHFDEHRLNATLASRRAELQALHARLFSGLDESETFASATAAANARSDTLAAGHAS